MEGRRIRNHSSIFQSVIVVHPSKRVIHYRYQRRQTPSDNCRREFSFPFVGKGPDGGYDLLPAACHQFPPGSRCAPTESRDTKGRAAAIRSPQTYHNYITIGLRSGLELMKRGGREAGQVIFIGLCCLATSGGGQTKVPISGFYTHQFCRWVGW